MGNIKQRKINLTRDELYDLYVVQQMTSKEIGELFNCSSKTVRNTLYRMGIPVRQNGEAVKLERSKWSTQKEQARSRKFIQNWNNKSQEEREEITKKRIKNINSDLAIQKARETKFLNGSYKISKSENNFYNKLKLFIQQDDIIRGYIDNRYPFNCDFYIKSKDLFIEYQGHQTHGTKPYDELDLDSINDLEELTLRGYSTTTLTIRDPNKLKIAKQNKINLLLIYPKNDTYLVHNGTIENIGKFDLTKINELC